MSLILHGNNNCPKSKVTVKTVKQSNSKNPGF